MTELEITPEPLLEPAVLPVTPPVQIVPRPVKSPLGPILVGFFTVIILSALLGFLYFKAKFQQDMAASSPTPSPSSSPVVSPSPALTPSPESTGSPKPSVKASVKPSATPKAATPTPTPTPVNAPTLDVRFGNPSANIKQTIDEGNGDGRVINREYSSIQVGGFDEVPSSWSPKITACFHIVANETIAGKDLKFKLTVDDKAEVEDNLGQYDKLEAGRTYDWCHDLTLNIGKHTARMTINSGNSPKEGNLNNNAARVDWENLADKIAPNFVVGGPFDWDNKGTCFVTYEPSDNVTPTKDLKIEQKVDAEAPSPLVDGTYCFDGESGSTHSYSVKISDARGNVNEQKKTFVLY